MSLGEGHLTRIPAQKLCPGVAPGYTIPLGHPDGWVAGAGLELDTATGREVVVTSNADINARGCAWIPIAMSHCHASQSWEVGPRPTRASVWWSLPGPCLCAICIAACDAQLVCHRAAPPACNACLCSAGAMGCWHDTRPSQPWSQWCSSPSEGAPANGHQHLAGEQWQKQTPTPHELPSSGPSWVVWAVSTV